MSIQRYARADPITKTAMALAFLEKNPGIRNGLVSGAKYAYNSAASALSFPAAPRVANLMPSSSKRSKKTRQRGRRKNGASPFSLTPPASQLDLRPRARFTFAIPITTATTTGILNSNLWLGYKDTTSFNDLSTISTQYTNIAKNFIYQTIHRIEVSFEPTVAYTTSGWTAGCFYPDPTVAGSTTSTTIQQYKQRPYSYAGDIKTCQSIQSWTPGDEEEREAKEVADASAASNGPRRNYGLGYVLFTVNTNATSGATFVGHIFVTLDIELHGLI